MRANGLKTSRAREFLTSWDNKIEIKKVLMETFGNLEYLTQSIFINPLYKDLDFDYTVTGAEQILLKFKHTVSCLSNFGLFK